MLYSPPLSPLPKPYTGGVVAALHTALSHCTNVGDLDVETYYVANVAARARKSKQAADVTRLI